MNSYLTPRRQDAKKYKEGSHAINAPAPTSTLQVFATTGGQLIGTLTNNGGGKYTGQFNSSTNPQSITVRSSSGGSATRAIVVK